MITGNGRKFLLGHILKMSLFWRCSSKMAFLLGHILKMSLFWRFSSKMASPKLQEPARFSSFPFFYIIFIDAYRYHLQSEIIKTSSAIAIAITQHHLTKPNNAFSRESKQLIHRPLRLRCHLIHHLRPHRLLLLSPPSQK